MNEIKKVQNINFNTNTKPNFSINTNQKTIKSFNSEIINELVETVELSINNNLKVSDRYIKENFNAKYYNKELLDYLSQYHTIREKTVAAAIFLATKFPKLPYYYGGGHESNNPNSLKGINPNWGTPLEEGDISSLDCSGFVSWCLINGGYPLPSDYDTRKLRKAGEVHSITEENIIDKLQVGDLADKARGDEHVGIIVDVNKDKKEITVAHVSGSGGGMNLTTISTQTGLITNDEVGAKDQHTENRKNTKYFENIVIFPYD